MNPKTRPAWFFEKAHYGGILCDIASHQFDQFLFFTGSTKAEIVASQVGNVNHPQYPGLEDFGDVMLARQRRHRLHPRRLVHARWPEHVGRRPAHRARHRTASSRSARTSTSAAARAAATCSWSIRRRRATSTRRTSTLPYGERLVDDVLNRTETAMPQAHTFLAMELALKAEQQARRITT